GRQVDGPGGARAVVGTDGSLVDPDRGACPSKAARADGARLTADGDARSKCHRRATDRLQDGVVGVAVAKHHRARGRRRQILRAAERQRGAGRNGNGAIDLEAVGDRHAAAASKVDVAVVDDTVQRPVEAGEVQLVRAAGAYGAVVDRSPRKVPWA